MHACLKSYAYVITLHEQMLDASLQPVFSRLCATGRLLVMEAQAAVDARTHEGISPLYVALQNGCFSVAQLLIDSGADVDARTLTGNTALHMAATRGLVEVGEMLIQRGCDVNARTSRLHTPLHLAIEHDQLQMALQLLANGAATDARDSLGNSPLHLASFKGSPALVSALLAHGAPVNALCARRLTPLDVGVYKEAPRACIEALLAKGAILERHPWTRQTALHAAAFLGRRDLVDLLSAKGLGADASVHLQTGDGLRERAGCESGTCSNSFEAVAAAYGDALACNGADEEVAGIKAAALLRLGRVHCCLAPSSSAANAGDGLADRPGAAWQEGGGRGLQVAADLFQQAWYLHGGGAGQELDEYVADRIRLGRAGKGGKCAAATRLEDICVRMETGAGVDKALALWRQQGVVVFPELLDAQLVASLQAQVQEACDADGQGIDRSANIRQPSKRTLRALSVAQHKEPLEAIAKGLEVFLSEALSDDHQLLLEYGGYEIQPGAAAQDWHRDDSVIDSRVASIQIALTDTVSCCMFAFVIGLLVHTCNSLISDVAYLHP